MNCLAHLSVPVPFTKNPFTVTTNNQPIPRYHSPCDQNQPHGIHTKSHEDIPNLHLMPSIKHTCLTSQNTTPHYNKAKFPDLPRPFTITRLKHTITQHIKRYHRPSSSHHANLARPLLPLLQPRRDR